MEKVYIYIVKYWEEQSPDANPFDPQEPAIFKVVGTEKKAEKIVEDFPHMFYDEYEVEQ